MNVKPGEYPGFFAFGRAGLNSSKEPVLSVSISRSMKRIFKTAIPKKCTLSVDKYLL